MRVLLIDDNATFLHTVQAYLTSRDHTWEIDALPDPALALGAIRAIDYAVVVTDLRLKGVDGLQVIQECRKLRPDTPVVLLTGYGDVTLEHQAAELGAYAFLHKPVDPDVFYSVVKRATLRADILRRSQQALEAENTGFVRATAHIRSRMQQLNDRLQQTVEKNQHQAMDKRSESG